MDLDIRPFVLLLSFIMSQVEALSSLKCYACDKVKDYRSCEVEEKVINCGDLPDAMNTNYNRCATETFTYKNGTIRYSKRCVVGPCMLENKAQNTVLHVAQCNPSPAGDGNVCMKCCPDDKCNLGSGSSRVDSSFFFSLSAFALVKYLYV